MLRKWKYMNALDILLKYLMAKAFYEAPPKSFRETRFNGLQLLGFHEECFRYDIDNLAY
jgi:hypothetical protein